ncbi:FecR family protein [Oceanobacter antarcticus]|jgi:transmembrane sensor|uniref:FecR family protein n=1 Tax=Oceanobacter antarcticus TaxID=3133425 RepID=A0ABW8NMX1_9GAMM
MNTQTHTPQKADNTGTIKMAAADWCMRIQSDECSPLDRAAFEQWLQENPEHEQAYNKILRVWLLSEHLVPSSVEARQEENPPAETSGIVQLPPYQQPPRWQWQQNARLLSLAALLLIPFGYGGWLLNWLPNEYHRYSTDQVRQEVTLPDGTQVEMNLNTHITYANFRDRRHVDISGNGEAFFKVAHNATHPFEISAANGTITVTGTAFNVWKYQQDVVVTVAAGSVIVSNNASDLHLTPGMQAEYSGHDSPQSEPGNIDQALAWQSGKLVLDDQPLSVAIPQIDRYLDHSITLNDAAVANLRIGGIYNTDNLDGLVDSLPQALPLTVEKRLFGGLVLSSRHQ